MHLLISVRVPSAWQAMDTEGSQSVGFDQLCRGLRRLDFSPPILITMSDFAVITQNGALSGRGGEMGPGDFELAFRLQLRLFLQVRAGPWSFKAWIRRNYLSGVPREPERVGSNEGGTCCRVPRLRSGL